MPKFNFSAGPAVIHPAVLEKARQEFLNYNGTSCNVMELSHRSADFLDILARAKRDLTDLLQLPSNYHILFLTGGATMQFSQIVYNLIPDLRNSKRPVDYLVTGTWSQKAAEEAKRLYENVNIVFSTQQTKHNGDFPPTNQWKWSLSERPHYVYYCDNETVHGVELNEFPLDGAPYNSNDVPVICDMSSNFLSRPIANIERFALIFAGAQKNIGPAGVTVLILRDDLLQLHRKHLHQHSIPVMMDYLVAADNDSLYNTPPTYPIYMAGLVFEHMLATGGLQSMAEVNRQKSELLYNYIDNESDGFYYAPVAKKHRSRMNVVFRIRHPKSSVEFNGGLEKLFAKEADSLAGLSQLSGHRSVGGLRASIYNAMSIAGVHALVDFMREFKLRNSA